MNENFRRMKTVKRTFVLVTSENLGHWRGGQNPKHSARRWATAGSDSVCGSLSWNTGKKPKLKNRNSEDE